MIRFYKGLYVCLTANVSRSASTSSVHVRHLSHKVYLPKSDPPNPVPLVLLHGLFGNGRNLGSIAMTVSREARAKVVTVDLRNHGDSPHEDHMDYLTMAEDVVSLMGNLSGQPGSKFDLLGHSMGGKVAMALALTQPELIRHLIVEDIHPGTWGGSHEFYTSVIDRMTEFQPAANRPLSKLRIDAAEHLKPLVPDRMRQQFFSQNLVMKEKSAQWCLNLSSLRRNMPTLLTFPALDPDLQYIDPVLFINGANSKIVGSRELDVIYQRFPSATVEVVQGAGHWVHSEKSSEFVDLVLKWIARPV